MHKADFPKDITQQKHLNIEDAKLYCQIGRRSLINIATRAGAIRKIGRRVLIDRATLDEYIDSNCRRGGNEKCSNQV